MSYPPPRYAGDGEVSGVLRRRGSVPDLVYAHGVEVRYLATAQRTDGLFGLYRWDLPARAGGPGCHFHRTMTESFFVLSGEVTVYDGVAWRVAGAGEFLHVPAGGLHGFRNDADTAASMLLHFAPGAPREGFSRGWPAWPPAAR